MKIEKGIYWDEMCNPLVTDRCSCEVVNCWAKGMMRRLPGLNPSPDENGIGWYPHRMRKIARRGASKVYGICWLGDIGWPQIPRTHIEDIFDELNAINSLRFLETKIGEMPDYNTFLFLTKYLPLLAERLKNIEPIAGGWIGTSISNEDLSMTWRLSSINEIKNMGWNTWLSVEPLLERIVIPKGRLSAVSQVIVGAETGPGARPCNPDWIRSIRDQCGEAGVPFFLKQADAKRNRELDGRTYDDLVWRRK